jgi:tetratricopeptide (TPR) repeat protein
MGNKRSLLKPSLLSAALSLAVLTMGGAGMVSTVVAAEAKKQSVSAEVAKQLKPAQDAIQKGDFDAAIPLAKAGLAASKTSYDKETSLRMLGFALGKKQDFVGYAEVLEQLNELDTVPVEEKNKNYKPLSQIYGQQKQYDKALAAANKWAETGGGSEAYAMLSTIYLIQKDYKNGVVALEKSMEGREPTEAELKQQNFCYYTLQDKAKRMAVMEELLAKFPTRDYYTDLLNVYVEQGFNERVRIQLYRYGLERGYLSRESEYVEFSDSLNNIGAPAEALKVMQKGIDSGAVKLLSATDRNSKLLAAAKQGAAEDRKDIPKQAKEVEGRKNGEADVKLGLAYLSLGDTEHAIEALSRGLSAERVKDVKNVDDAYMTLGIAYLRSGKKAEAAKAFEAAKANPQMAKAAALWLTLTT